MIITQLLLNFAIWIPSTSEGSNCFLYFARKCTKHEKTQDIFPLNTNESSTRDPEKYQVTFARTYRLANAAVLVFSPTKHKQANSFY